RYIGKLIIQSSCRYDSKNGIPAIIIKSECSAQPNIPLKALCFLHGLMVLIHQLQYCKPGSKLKRGFPSLVVVKNMFDMWTYKSTSIPHINQKANPCFISGLCSCIVGGDK